jgi:MscS family membrane protein
LSQSSVENFASRGKTLVQTRLHLRYGTTAEQLGSILEGVGSLIAENPKPETATSRVRLVDFSDRAIELELFAYVLTADGADFLLVRQDLLLRIASIVESSGSGFAQPTQFVYMDREVHVERPSRDAVAHDDVRLAQSSVG